METADKSKTTGTKEDSVSEDDCDEFVGSDQKSTKQNLATVGMIKNPRIASAGVAEAVKAIITRNKQCRRQTKKAPTSRK